MIKIVRDDLPQIAKDFNDYLSLFLGYGKKDSRGNLKPTKIDQEISKARDGRQIKYAEMLEFYNDKYKDIGIIKSVSTLYEINEEFKTQFDHEISVWIDTPIRRTNNYNGITKKETPFGKFQSKMISLYDGFMKSKAPGYENIGHWLAKRLNVTTCPYCNRHYTFTVRKTSASTVIRPQFDHFLPKSIFPLTALCFYNLIPACADCNKAKSDDLISIHPYEDSFSSNKIKFYIDPLSSSKNPYIRLSNENHSNVSVLALAELYRKHESLATDLLNKAIGYNHHYYESLIRSFSSLGMTEVEIERMVWGASLSESHEVDRPFTKLTRDILTQFGLLSQTPALD